MFQIERHFIDDMIAHARAEDPNECCGLLVGKDGRVVKLFRTTNSEKSPECYKVEPGELLQVYNEMDTQGWELLAIYHSHPHTQAIQLRRSLAPPRILASKPFIRPSWPLVGGL